MIVDANALWTAIRRKVAELQEREIEIMRSGCDVLEYRERVGGDKLARSLLDYLDAMKKHHGEIVS